MGRLRRVQTDFALVPDSSGLLADATEVSGFNVCDRSVSGKRASEC